MDSWHATSLGRRHLPRELTAFKIEVFFQFSAEEARIIGERRRQELKLGLALQIGFLRMSGRLLDAVRIVPPLLRRHLRERFSVVAAPTHTAERDRVDEEANVAPLLWFIGGVSVLRTSCVARHWAFGCGGSPE
jgi:hypothetical protein